MIKASALSILMFSLATVMTHAQKGPTANVEPASPWGSVHLPEYVEGSDNSITVGTITLAVSTRPGEGESEVPIYSVREDDREVLRFEGTANYMSFLPISAELVQLDPSTPEVEVITSTYTGGAHCCEELHVASVQPDGSWEVELLGYFDGGFSLTDPDGDGKPALQVVDQSFLYTFDCYACSLAPPLFIELREGTMVDVSAEPEMELAYSTEMHGLQFTPERYQEPGWLAGWAAIRARLGEGEQALADIAAVSGGGDVIYDYCTSGESPFDCPQGNLREMGFVDFLRAHLIEQGYISETSRPGGKG